MAKLAVTCVIGVVTETTARLGVWLTVLLKTVDDRVCLITLMPTLESGHHQALPALAGFAVAIQAAIHLFLIHQHRRDERKYHYYHRQKTPEPVILETGH